jgi:peptidoglycan hydrolase FlgJ
VDLATAERMTSVADPRGLSALHKQSSDPAAAKAVAGEFGALLMQGLMQGSDGGAIPMAGGVGGNIVNSLFANTISQAAMSGDKLGLADVLFRSIEAKQHPATGGSQESQVAALVPQTQQPGTAPPTAPPSAIGFALSPYWQGNGVRPLGSNATRGHFESPNGSVAALPPIPNTNKVARAASNSDLRPISGSAASPFTNIAGTPNASIGDSRGSGAASSAGKQYFTEQLGPLLQEAGRQLGVSPRILLAQAALETGWGRSVIGNNVFGIKASSSWQGAQVTTPTHEYEAGQMVAQKASFRAYPTLDAAVQDYVALVAGSGRYRAVIGSGDDAGAYARGLAAGGYATDPEYARKLEAIAAGPSVTAAFAAPNRPTRLSLFNSGS